VPDGKPFAFHDLPADSFPFTAELLDTGTGETVWSATVSGPGALRIPSAAEVNEGRPVSARITLADGDVVTEGEAQDA